MEWNGTDGDGGTEETWAAEHGEVKYDTLQNVVSRPATDRFYL
jgi:hypothetical protein